MTLTYLTLLVLLGNLVQGLNGLTCFSCLGIAHPRFCDYVEDCTSEQVCGIESVVHPHGHTVFNIGCFDRKTCVESGTGTQPMCRHCCTSNMCNMAGCGEIGIIHSRGPICYNCKGVLTMDECTTVSVCEQNQACLIEEHYNAGERFFTTSCQYTNVCEALSNGLGLPVIGKRSSSKMYRSSSTCNKCCFTDLCNNRCNKQSLTTRNIATIIRQETITSSSTQTTTSNAIVTTNRIPITNSSTYIFTTTRSPITTSSEMEHVKDCNDLKGTMYHSGVYHIYPSGAPGYKVYCDMDTDGGGWTVFQYRSGGLLSFHTKLWADYKNGFGEVSGEHWLGNDRVHQLTGLGNNVLRIYLEDWEGNSRYAVFNNFSLGDEVSNYILSYGSYSGNAGNSLANNMQFTTADRQNDGRGKGDNCAKDNYGGPWWYTSMCGSSDLNGEYVNVGKGVSDGKGVVWSGWKGWDYSMKVTKMMMNK
ncbi:angiopoietin-related protein 7-like [Mytilus edulis]|uniref:angiopoietin-related protein 7-like n=1 Tax=Mytilus edulis TaxID=6550 RepID=UPI0039EE118E